ncbi:hypothetical protein CAEBREN_12722 [Caenorhabditis brenneri]|uniref:Uncharacterized protein n=1 Tax=Caenorhabditis brenneri TaxID=135651 RepID=G0N773_CAEBE|nr:hypothetical protein CAEBREN_12722 [Caenorhabditis brenneri]
MMLLTANCMGLAYIWYRNVRVYKTLDKSLIIPSKYTLQARFQAKENMRSFHFTKYSLALITATLFLEYGFIMCQSLDFLQKYEVYINYFMEFCNSTHPNVVIPTMMVSVPSWKRRFFFHFTCIPGVKTFVLDKKKKGVATVEAEQIPKIETEEYFNQFKMAWG